MIAMVMLEACRFMREPGVAIEEDEYTHIPSAPNPTKVQNNSFFGPCTVPHLPLEEPPVDVAVNEHGTTVVDIDGFFTPFFSDRSAVGSHFIHGAALLVTV